MKMHPIRKAAMAAMLATSLIMGCGSAAFASQGTVNVGLSIDLSGSIASLGITGRNGVNLAIHDINAKGGLLGKKIRLVSADSEAKPSMGVNNVRNFILSDHIKAIFGPLSSAVAAAEEGIAAQYHLPIFFFESNDIDLTTKHFTKYAFQVVPNTHMESYGIAAYIAKRDWKNVYTVSPDYSFGHSTVEEFRAGMKKYGANIKVVGQQWPKLGASDFTQYISAILSKKPDALFIGQYAGDLITFTKQAEGYNLFKKMHVYAGYWLGTLTALGAKAPAGVISSSRAPFYAIHTKGMRRFTKAYHDKYGDWPSAWAVMGYSAVQAWAQGVKQAGSFNADKVSAALSGATVKNIRGPFKFRACDHQATVPEYVGTLSKTLNPKYGIRTIANVHKTPPEKIMLTCKQAKAMQPS